MKQMKRGLANIFELTLVLGVIVFLYAVVFRPIQTYYQAQQKMTVASIQARKVESAMNKYIQDNTATIVAATTPTTPYTITIPVLVNAGYLPPGFSSTNAYYSNYQNLIFQPVPNKLHSMTFLTGGVSLSMSEARRLAIMIGGTGGYIEGNVAKGAGGGWEEDLSAFGGFNPGNGHIVIAGFYSNGTVANDYLYRKAVPGHPELNTMSTAINMSENDVNAARNVTASGTVTAGNATINGSTRTAGETYTGGWFRTTGDTGWYSEKWGGGFHMTDPSWIRAYGDKSIYTGGQVQAGSIQSNGRMTANEYLQLNGVATANTRCAPDGLVGRAVTGDILSCQSGVWKSTKGSTVLTGLIGHGQQIPLPAGFSQNQCQWSVSNSENPHGWRPEYYAGSVATSDANRIVMCGYYDSYAFYPGTNRTDISGRCSYIVSCV